MRFVWAIAAFVLAALMIAAGIAQRTVFQGPTSLTTTVHTTGDAPFTVIDGAVLGHHPGSQTVRAAAHGQVFLSYGRADDVKAWLAGATYNRVSLDGGNVVTTVIGPDGKAVGSASSSPSPSLSPSPTTTATPGPGSDSASTAPMVGAHDPVGSDLWLEEFQQKDLLVEPLQLPSGMSVLIATDGTKPAPAAISVTWPLSSSTPWAGPLIVLGGILMLVGVFLYILAIRHVRRSRGPRRKSPPPLPTAAADEPEDLAVAQADKGVISSGSAESTRRSRRAFIAVPLAFSALLFAGCTPDAWPHMGGSASPTPSATVAAADQQTPAVTEPQAEQILARISKTVHTADAKMDANTAATRLDGAPLAEREANYTIRQNAKGISALAPIPTTGLAKGVVLPQAYDGWPRTVMLIAAGTGGNAPSTIMMMSQADPWSNYKLAYTAQLQPATQIPDLAPSYVGASAVPPDSSFLVTPPNQLASAYADVLNNGDKSQYAGLFDKATDTFLEQTKKAHAAQLAAFNKSAKKGGQTGSMTFLASAGSSDPSALATLDSGAIVAVQVNDSTITKPTSSGAVIFASPEAKALTGTKQSSTGYTTTYSDELFFYVPGQGGANTKIQMLGYASDILSAKVNKK
ncbi:hypothetical protein LK09_12305 [Microbacterium mangrovi]|uniref:DUF8094 domain-containing protein n=1 Tax=Microbacterium mangrovi TaxID=1348253 RepID=A0A0B2A1Z5_9MICO|nr:hypothetical protein [Microbacterium mangrovi]KHK97519.1 hypothetical protein LK09_12305 [Microbacterium mangrovi]